METEGIAMRYGYRGKRRTRRVKRGTLAVLLVLTAVFLVSCVAGSDPMWIKGLFGIDVANYGNEPTLQEHAPDGKVASELSNTVEILLSDDIELATFENTSQAVKYYRDEILNDMLRDHYTAYTGNTQLLSKVTTVYPQANYSTLIPKKDFENTVFRYFGGTGVSHKDGEIFTYLSRADGYTAPLQAWESKVALQVLTVVETEHTFRMQFTLSDGSDTSTPYSALFVKRADGSFYLSSLGKVN